MSIEDPITEQEQINGVDNPKSIEELGTNLPDHKEKIDKAVEVMADLQVIMNIENHELQKQAIKVFVEKRFWRFDLKWLV